MGTVKPGDTVRKVVWLLNRNSPGKRLLDFSIRSSPHLEGPGESELAAAGAAHSLLSQAEHLRTISVPVVRPFHCSFDPSYRHSFGVKKKKSKVLDLQEPDAWSDACRAVVHARLGCLGPWPVDVQSITLVATVSLFLYLFFSALDLARPLIFIFE
jgi:hypothetical protein